MFVLCRFVSVLIKVLWLFFAATVIAVSAQGNNVAAVQTRAYRHTTASNTKNSSNSTGTIHGPNTLNVRRPSIAAPRVDGGMSAVSLADRLMELAPTDTDFLKRLREEEEQAQFSRQLAKEGQSTRKNRPDRSHTEVSFIAKSVVGSILLLGAASFLGGETTLSVSGLLRDLKKVFLSALAVNSWSVVRWMFNAAAAVTSDPTSTSTGAATSSRSQTLGVLAVTLGRPELLVYLWENVVPVVGQTLRKMLVAEVWNRFFAKLFKAVGSVLTAALQSSSLVNIGGGSDIVWRDPPLWMQRGQSLLASAVKRGTKKLFQSTLQKYLHQAAAVVIHVGRDAIQDQVQFQLTQFFPSGAETVKTTNASLR